MIFWKILAFVYATLVFVGARRSHHQKREVNLTICDAVLNNTNKIQCYCTKSAHEQHQVKTADCYPMVDGVTPDDDTWDSFDDLKHATKLILTNSRGVALKYVPTKALTHTRRLLKLDVKYGNIETVQPFAFANLSTIKEIALRDNQIKTLKINSFAHHPNLKCINLDSNNLIEVNRDVFMDLPLLEKLFLTNNKITTIHDRAFVHLTNLKELEIDRNNIFSLNSESFSGLRNLDKLDLSSNSLEVIGDNTFLPLKALRILNVVGNKIQMIDERGFHGLLNLQALALAHNALTNLDNENIFEGLISLSSLSLKANPLRELKQEVLAPILKNFYGPTSSLDVEDINFPCDCRLDWFITLMNKTESSHLKQAMENLKCVPDPILREKYNNSEPQFEDDQEDVQRNAGEETQGQDYEFYDDSQLDGKLFYTDLRFLLNCSENASKPINVVTTTKAPTTKVTSVPVTTKATPKVITTTKSVPVSNRGLLDLFAEESAKTESDRASETTPKPENQENKDIKANSFTTTRLATVSAKPMENKYEEHRMASDEAKPDNIKVNRIIQEDTKDAHPANNANNVKCVSMLITVVLLRFY